MDALRSTMVEAAFRPKDESPRNLLDFVDEHGVETMRESFKEFIRASKVKNEALTSSDSTYTTIGSSDRIRFLDSRLRQPFT